MDESNGVKAVQETSTKVEDVPSSNLKGKGPALDPEVDMDDDDDDEESDAEEELEDEDEEEDDNNEVPAEQGEGGPKLEMVDTSNILSGGRRTRGKNIDFAKAAESAGPDLDDEEDDEDDDFKAEDDDEDAMRD